MTPTGVITAIPMPNIDFAPSFMTFGPDGNLWITEFNNNKIARMTLGGTTSEFPVITPNSDLTDITTGPDGNLWIIASSGKVDRITPAGVVKEFPLPGYPSSGAPTGIAAGADGNLWFTNFDRGQIGRITP
jgi:streptogramin lyase